MVFGIGSPLMARMKMVVILGWVSSLIRLSSNFLAAISLVSVSSGAWQHMTSATVSTSALQSGQKGVLDSPVWWLLVLVGAQWKMNFSRVALRFQERRL